MAQRLLYFVRHGQYDMTNRDDGSLTERGQQQAILTGQALAAIPFDTAHYSTILRAVETSQLIGASMPQVERQSSDLLRECIPPMEPHLIDFFALRGPYLSRHQMRECSQRIEDAQAALFQPPTSQTRDEYELVVCHGNVIRYLVTRILGAPDTAWTTMLIHNCSITRMVVNEGGQPFLLSFNDTGHLPPHLLTDH